MSDALPLPPRPDLEQYKTLAKELVRAHEAGEVPAWARRWLESLARHMNMDQAPYIGAMIDGGVDWLTRHWKKREGSSLTDAQFLIARAHGFESWPKFSKHVQSMAGSDGSPFERAADAIVEGDIETLRALLREHPGLVHERSAREHRSTLLHYVAANGIEDFRQKTPPNIVEIARLLLDAGADVNAESDAYGGRSTALGLAATSVHPENAGVQNELMGLLLDRGATLNGPDGRINACLANGRGAAAAYLADHGAKLDLEGAAGVGRLDLVRQLVEAGAPREQWLAGYIWACEFGHIDVVAYLLDRGLSAAASQQGATGLHWAAYEGNAGLVKLLLERGAPVDGRDEAHEGTPLDWALYGWGHIGPRLMETRRHADVVALLVRAGATIAPSWYEERHGLWEKVQADARMRAALTGELPAG